MWYVIIGGIILWVMYRYNKKKQSGPTLTVSMHVDNSGWEEAKKQKASSLKTLKKSFKPAPDNETALADTLSTLIAFHENHGQSLSEIEASVKSLNLPDDLTKLEAALRREINRFYKQRDDLKSKAVAIQLSYQHVQLQLQNPDHDWKNFAGLQKLQSNWKAEEYFNGLLIMMTAFESTFPNSSNAEKLSSDIERMFELWNSQNIARDNFESQVEAYDTAKTASDKHFVILSIIEYLDRRYKFNPSFQDELIGWCLKDIDLYEDFLKSFHEYDLFTTEQQMEFYDNPGLKEKKLAAISFARVKKLKNYMVPRLNSYDVLSSIYQADGNTGKLQWLQNIGVNIGYIDGVAIEPSEEKAAFDYKTITREIEVSKSGQKGKLAFLDSKGEACSTESAFKDHAEQQGWHVMRAEVSFWQAIDGRYEQIRSINLSDFINQQIKRSEGTWTRLIYNGDQDMLAYAKSEIVQDFLQRIDSDTFARIVYRIAQNPNENRSGVSDFIIWNDNELRMVEVKKVREQIRESQLNWISWMIEENIPIEIVRIKAM